MLVKDIIKYIEWLRDNNLNTLHKKVKVNGCVSRQFLKFEQSNMSITMIEPNVIILGVDYYKQQSLLYLEQDKYNEYLKHTLRNEKLKRLNEE